MELDSVLAGLIFGGVGLMMGLFVYLARRESQRAERWEAAARKLGFSFSRDLPPSVLPLLDHFYIFSRYDSYKAYHAVQGEIEGCRMVTFDAEGIFTDQGRNHIKRFTCILFHAHDLAPLPATVVGGGILQPVLNLFSGEQVEIAAPPPLNRAYRHVGEDGAQQFLFPKNQFVAFYDEAAQTRQPGAGQWLLYSQIAYPAKPEALEAFLTKGLRFFDLFRQPGRLREPKVPLR